MRNIHTILVLVSNSEAMMKTCAVVILTGIVLFTKAQDPCTDHSVLNDETGTLAYELGPGDPPLCDNELQSGWYRFDDGGSGHMASSCPVRTQCGSSDQLWMNGNVPTVEDNEVTREICWRKQDVCCDRALPADVKNCTTFVVYSLLSIQADLCPVRYCFVGEGPQSTTAITTATAARTTTTTAATKTAAATTTTTTITQEETSVGGGSQTTTRDNTSGTTDNGDDKSGSGQTVRQEPVMTAVLAVVITVLNGNFRNGMFVF